MPRLSKHEEEGRFYWCCRNLDLGDLELTKIVRTVCRMMVVWPEDVVGRVAAGKAVSFSSNPRSKPPQGYVYSYSRWLCWRLAYVLTDHSVENIADILGGFSYGHVGKYARSWQPFIDYSPDNWLARRRWIVEICLKLGVTPEDMPPR